MSSSELNKDYIITTPFDLRAMPTEAAAVAKAAIESGVARTNVESIRMRTQELTHIIRERYAKTRDLWQRARLIAGIDSCRLLGEALSRGIEGGEDYAKSYAVVS